MVQNFHAAVAADGNPRAWEDGRMEGREGGREGTGPRQGSQLD